MSDPGRRKRRRGRPSIVEGQRSVPTYVALPEAIFDDLARRATRAGSELAPFLRRILTDYSQGKSTRAKISAHPVIH